MLLMSQTWFEWTYSNTDCKSTGTKLLPGSGYWHVKLSENCQSRAVLRVYGDASRWQVLPAQAEALRCDVNGVAWRHFRLSVKTERIRECEQRPSHAVTLKWLVGVPGCQREMSDRDLFGAMTLRKCPCESVLLRLWQVEHVCPAELSSFLLGALSLTLSLSLSLYHPSFFHFYLIRCHH